MMGQQRERLVFFFSVFFFSRWLLTTGEDGSIFMYVLL